MPQCWDLKRISGREAMAAGKENFEARHFDEDLHGAKGFLIRV